MFGNHKTGLHAPNPQVPQVLTVSLSQVHKLGYVGHFRATSSKNGLILVQVAGGLNLSRSCGQLWVMLQLGWSLGPSCRCRRTCQNSYLVSFTQSLPISFPRHSRGELTSRKPAKAIPRLIDCITGTRANHLRTPNGNATGPSAQTSNRPTPTGVARLAGGRDPGWFGHVRHGLRRPHEQSRRAALGLPRAGGTSEEDRRPETVLDPNTRDEHMSMDVTDSYSTNPYDLALNVVENTIQSCSI